MSFCRNLPSRTVRSACLPVEVGAAAVPTSWRPFVLWLRRRDGDGSGVVAEPRSLYRSWFCWRLPLCFGRRRWCAGGDSVPGAGGWNDGCRSTASSRLGRRGGFDLGTEIQHGEFPRSTCHIDNGFATCGELLHRLLKPATAMVLPRLRRGRLFVRAGPPGPSLYFYFFWGVFCTFSRTPVFSRFLSMFLRVWL